MSRNIFCRVLPVLIGAAASITGASSASAATYVVDSTGLDGNPGGLWGYVHYNGPEGPATDEAAGIGRIYLHYSNAGGGTLLTYCVDLFDWLGNGNFVGKPLADTGYSAFRLSELTDFITHADALVSGPGATADMSAAAQLGVWEILYEALGANGGRPAYDVTSGDFSAAGGSLSTDSLNLANLWLGKLSDTSADGWSTPLAGTVVNFVDPNVPGVTPGNQGQVFVTTQRFGLFTSAAPEPASWAMMILGFGVVGYATRRRHVRFTAAA